MSLVVTVSGQVGRAPLQAMVADPEITLEFEQVVPLGKPVCSVAVSGEHQAAAAEQLRESMHGSVMVVDQSSDRTLLRIAGVVLAPEVVAALDETTTVLLDVAVGEQEWHLEVWVPDRDEVSAFLAACEQRAVTVSISRVRDADTYWQDPEYGLSTAQYATVRTAHDAGYFDVPRETTVKELAADLGVSEQAVSERLRRGLSTLLANALFDTVPEPGDRETVSDEQPDDDQGGQ